MEDPARVLPLSTPQDDLNQSSPQSVPVPETPVVPPSVPPMPETPPLSEAPLHPLPETSIPVQEKVEPPMAPKQLEETPLPVTPSSTEPPLVFRNPNEGGSKPRKPYLIGGAILTFLIVTSALAFYFFQKGGFGIQEKATGCPPASCTGSGYLCAGSCDCNWDVNKGVRWHYKCSGGSVEKYNEFDSGCDSSCSGGGGGGGGITCGADGSGIWVKNNGGSATTIAVSWFASYCERTDCFCSGGPSNENFTLQPGQTISRGFTNSHPACNWSWQTDVTAGSCHQTAHGCSSEACVSPTPTKIPTPTSAIVTGIATGTIPMPTATPTPKPPTATPTQVCCCWQGKCDTGNCQKSSAAACTSPAKIEQMACCTTNPTPTPTRSPLCVAAAQVAAATSGTGTKITVTSSHAYADVEIRVTSGGTTTPYQSPTMPSVGTWVWTVPKTLSSITAIAFYVDVSGLGSGGAACGTWSPPTPTPTTPLLACADVQVSVTGGGNLNDLKIGDSLSFLVTFNGTVQDVGIVIKKGGIRVKTLTAGGQRVNSWTSPAYTIDSLGSYEILGYIKTNGTWK